MDGIRFDLLLFLWALEEQAGKELDQTSEHLIDVAVK
jgi:hypothetical protein